MIKKIAVFTFLLSFSIHFSYSQNILTAADFFESVSQTVSAVGDYEADMMVKVGASSEMEGRVSFKQPNLLRIDFTNPATQAIVFNGNQLTIYLPNSNVILNQTVQSQGSSADGMSLATPEGLALMKRYYSIAYETGQDPVPLDPEAVGTPEAEEMVIKLVLTRRNTTEGFRTINLSISPDTLLIRRVNAVSVEGTVYMFDFTNYALNQNIPDMRFLFDMPSAGSTFNDFLFAESE